MKVYAMNIGDINPDDKKWYGYLSDKRIEKIKKLKRKVNKAQSIGAELLLRYAVFKITGKDENVKWDTAPLGKPYLIDYPHIHISISHSGDYAVCTVNDAPVGIDIQKHGEFDVRIAKRFFTHEENKYIADSKNPSMAFFRIWTKKESLVKAAGTGLTVPLDSFSVLGNKAEYNGNIYNFTRYAIRENNYLISVCSLENTFASLGE